MKNINRNIVKIIVVIFTLGITFGGFTANAQANTCNLSETEPGDVLVNFSSTTLWAQSGHTYETFSDVSIPAGEYEITMETYDDHSNHGGQGQNEEEVFLSLFNGSNLILNTSQTQDIPENEDYSITNLGTYDVNDSVSKVRVKHAIYPNGSSPESVEPVCALFEKVGSVYDDLQITCNVSDTNVNVDDLVIYSVDIDGGNSPYEYDWNGDTEGEDDDNPTLRVRYDNDGNQYVTVTVTDDDGNTDSDTCPTVRVSDDDDLQITCEVSDTSVDVDDLVIYSVDIDGGNSPYEYDWNGDTEGENDDNPTLRVRYDNDGNQYVTVTVTDDDGNRDSDTCSTVRVSDDDDDDLRVTCEVSDTSVDIDDLVIYSVDIDGGNSPYEYEWDGDIEDEDDDERRVRVRYDDDGRYKVEITVTDDDGNRDSDTCSTVRVSDDDNNDINVISRGDGNLAGLSSVYLNQVPYTGPADDAARIIMFILMILLFSTIVSLKFLKRYKKGIRSAEIGAFKTSNKERNIR